MTNISICILSCIISARTIISFITILLVLFLFVVLLTWFYENYFHTLLLLVLLCLFSCYVFCPSQVCTNEHQWSDQALGNGPGGGIPSFASEFRV